MKPSLLPLQFCFLFLLGIVPAHTLAAQTSPEKQNPSTPGFARDATVYVSDFELDAQA